MPALSATGFVVRYGDVVAVGDVDLTLRPGEVTALMGRNGSGKSSLLFAGVLHHLAASEYWPPGFWHITPFRPGANPVEACAQELGAERVNAQDHRATPVAPHPPAQRERPAREQPQR